MRYPGEPWVPRLQAALTGATVRDAAGTFSTTRYTIVPGQETALVDGLTDLVMFLWQGVADVAAVASWGGGGLAREASWSRLLITDTSDDYIVLKPLIGEALAWWYEESTPEVSFAGRPSIEVGQPVIDSLSLLECEGARVVRAVQAKAGYGASRPRFREATAKFKRLQNGEFDSFWNDRLRQFQLELRAEGIPPMPASYLLATGLAHFAILVAHALPSTGDPGRDYGSRVAAHRPDGRALMLFEQSTLRDLVRQVAEAIQARRL